MQCYKYSSLTSKNVFVKPFKGNVICNDVSFVDSRMTFQISKSHSQLAFETAFKKV